MNGTNGDDVRGSAPVMSTKDLRHGVRSSYTNGGCRCQLCRAASRSYVRAYTAAHREERAAYRAAWYAAHRDEIAARGAAQPTLVYAWIGPNGVADYVGRGVDHRARSHRWLARWWTPQHLLLSMTCESEWQAMEMEGVWGGRLLPRHNKDGYRHAAA